jgi:hypothetical protein
MLYALLIKALLPSDIDHQIAQIIFPMKKIKSLMIKNMRPKTIHHRTEIPLIENQNMTEEEKMIEERLFFS